MKFIAVLLLSLVAVFVVADEAKKESKVELKTRSKVVSTTCDTIKIVRCTKNVLTQTLKDTAVVVKEDKSTSVTYDTLSVVVPVEESAKSKKDK